MNKTGRHPSCTNCKERGLKCVDEYGQVKSVKLLRRGRRLQQAEALYGKVQPGDEEETLLSGPAPPTNVTPMLKPEFFDSSFWRRFHSQRPIIEPGEFCVRFISFTKGNADALGVPGKLLAMSLVVWASSFGFNEAGQPLDTFEDQIFQYQEQKANSHDTFDPESSARVRSERKAKTNEMLKEMLYLIDVHGVLRSPTWDGVRTLLIILPLTQEVQKNFERMTMYETTINMVNALSSSRTLETGEGLYVDSLVRARVFWFTVIHDWMINGLRGNRMLLTNDDLHSFETSLPPLDHNHRRTDSPRFQEYATVYQFFSIPLKLSAACRMVHGALTGPAAKRRKIVDEHHLQTAWSILDKAWHEIDQVRSLSMQGAATMPQDEVERYIASWQIFIFECNNIIREALKQRLVVSGDQSGAPSDQPISHDYHSAMNRLYTIAHSKCLYLVQGVVGIIKRYLGTPFFQFDAFVVRDGVFFAGFLLASERIGEPDDVNFCLSALREMRWAYSKSEERENTIRVIWANSRSNRNNHTLNQPATPQFSTAYAGPPLTQQYSRPTIARVNVSHLGTISPPISAPEDHWPPSAVSSGGGSDTSSPHSYQSPIDQAPPIHSLENVQPPFINEGYHQPHYVEDPIQSHQFQPPMVKSPPFDASTSAMYYQPHFQSNVTPYYGEGHPQTPSDSLPGPSNYQSGFYYNG